MKTKFPFNNFIYFIILWLINTMKLIDSEEIDINIHDLLVGKIIYSNQTNSIKKFNITIKANEENITDFINVNLKGTNKTLIKYILSFYKNDSNQRNQLFQSYNNEINMWLTKNQFNKNFYIEVECDKYPCAYNINIISDDYIKIKLDKIYSYYITKETENMEFLVNDTVPNGTKLLSIWANGNKYLNTSIGNYTENNNIYQYNYNDSYDPNFNLTLQVNGELDDIINIGALTFNESSYSSFVIKDNIEISGFINYYFMKKNCFVYNHSNYNGNLTLINKDLDYINIDFYQNNNSFCLSLKNEMEGQISYSFYYYIYKNSENNTEEMDSPYLYGFEQSTRYIKEDDSVFFVLVKPKDYFDYFIYHINEQIGFLNQENIYLCNNYPLCNYKNMKEIEIYQYSNDSIFTKKDLYNFSYFPLNKTQIIVELNCENAEKYINDSEVDKAYIPGYCLSDLYTYNEAYTSKYEIIKNNETIKYNISFNYVVYYIIINIEVMYGDISIDLESLDIVEHYLYKNKYLYEIQDSSIALNITGKKDISYYHISYSPKIMENKYYFIYLYNIGGNYLFLKNEETSLITIENKLNQNTSDPLPDNPTNDKIFIGFYPIKGEFILKSLENDNFKELEMDSLTFYQDIKILDKNYKNFSYKIDNIKNDEEENDDVLLSISVFNLSSEDGIILYKENPQLFKFSEENSEMKFTYFHKKNEKNSYGNEFCWIEIKSENNSPMDLKVYFNGLSLNKSNIGKEEEIKVNFTSQCFEEDVCKIKFNLTLKNISKSNIVKINIYTGNDYLYSIMLFSNLAIIVIIIIIVLLLIWDYKQSYSFKIKESNQYQIVEEEPDTPLFNN